MRVENFNLVIKQNKPYIISYSFSKRRKWLLSSIVLNGVENKSPLIGQEQYLKAALQRCLMQVRYNVSQEPIVAEAR